MKRILFLPALSVFLLIGVGCRQIAPTSEENTQAERLMFQGWGFIPSFTYPVGWQVSSPNDNNDRSGLVLYVTDGPYITLSDTGIDSPEVIVRGFQKDSERSYIDSAQGALVEEPEVYDNISVQEFPCSTQARCYLLTADILETGPAYTGSVIYNIIAETPSKVVMIEYFTLTSSDGLSTMETLPVRDFDFSPVFDAE